MCISYFTKDKIVTNLILNIGDCFAEKFTAQLDGGPCLNTHEIKRKNCAYFDYQAEF